ncbi:MAG: RNA polymerase sigma factor RpoH, partial [Betaproteobacteria bacterium]|nr:RNA polymerase sigma factor RpoH [Betaproteobacteria bacterium]
MSTNHALALNPAASFSLPAIGNLDAYISAVNRLPLLSAERETELGRKLRDQGDLDAARELILSHLRLVVSTARQYLGYGLAHADLIQEGNVGLMKAVKRFDPERGVRLVSFALHWIKAEIHEYILRNWRMVKVATTKAQRKLFFNLRSQKQELEKSASAQLTPDEVQTIAERLKVREADVLEMDMRLSGHELPLEPGGTEDEDSFAPIAYLAAPGADPEQQLQAREQDWLENEGLLQALDQLDPRSQRIIRARWLSDEGADSLTLHDLAAEFGVSAERIRQIEVKALLRLRQLLAH